jgi:uncharacterized protein
MNCHDAFQEKAGPFIDLAREGRNEWWRWLLGLGVVLVAWIGSGMVLGVLLVVWSLVDNNPDTYIDAGSGVLKGMDPIVTYIAYNSGHVALVVVLFLVVRFIHGRPFLSLVTAESRIDWRRLAGSLALWFGLTAVITLAEYLLHPSTYRLTFNPVRFLIFLPIALILTPLQTSGEELFFRGYLMQGLGLHTRNSVVLIVAIGVLFMLPHLLNPEVAAGFLPMALYYFSVGAFLAWITLRSNGLEYALGIHAGASLFSVLIANYDKSVMPSESIFYCSVLDPWTGLISFLVVAAVFSFVMLGLWTRQVPADARICGEQS